MKHYHRRQAISLLAALGCATLTACKILPIAAAEDPEKLAANRADAAAALWHEKALPHFSAAAKPASEVITAINADFDAAASQYGYRPKAEGAPWTFIIRGTAKVTAKNDTSRAGTLTLAMDDQPSVTLTLQIGPVVRGNAVRDSLPFISFSDYENQLDFAEIGKSLNSQAISAIEAAAKAAKPGSTITFIAVTSLSGKADKMLFTPVQLEGK